jgi:hypothetical protein
MSECSQGRLLTEVSLSRTWVIDSATPKCALHQRPHINIKQIRKGKIANLLFSGQRSMVLAENQTKPGVSDNEPR